MLPDGYQGNPVLSTTSRVLFHSPAEAFIADYAASRDLPRGFVLLSCVTLFTAGTLLMLRLLFATIAIGSIGRHLACVGSLRYRVAVDDFLDLCKNPWNAREPDAA
jgi:hypothetical protein